MATVGYPNGWHEKVRKSCQSSLQVHFLTFTLNISMCTETQGIFLMPSNGPDKEQSSPLNSRMSFEDLHWRMPLSIQVLAWAYSDGICDQRHSTFLKSNVEWKWNYIHLYNVIVSDRPCIWGTYPFGRSTLTTTQSHWQRIQVYTVTSNFFFFLLPNHIHDIQGQ